MSGSIQSSNYVPGVSGWKLDQATGDFEINSCTFGSAANAPERQMVSVEVASWSKYDLPKNAANLLQFMQAELQRVPEEYRHAAEFEEFDTSYGDESFNARLFLSYSRLETEEELADRLKKAKSAGTSVSIKNGLMVVTHDGVVRIKLGNLDQPEPEQPKPFKVDGDRVYINEATIKDGSITNLKLADLYAAGLGLHCMCAGGCTGNGSKSGDEAVLAEAIKTWPSSPGTELHSQFLTSADKFAIKEPTDFEKARAKGADAVLDLLGRAISKTELCEMVKASIDQLKEKQGAENRCAYEARKGLEKRIEALERDKDQVIADAKRGVADSILRDLEADKCGGSLSRCILNFGGYTGDIPLKR